MDITEKWLGDIAGWQVLKSAKGMLDRGLVAESGREGDRIRGVVMEGPKRYQSGLLIRSRTASSSASNQSFVARSPMRKGAESSAK